MTAVNKELAGRLVTGRKRDGRCTYDPGAKAEIVQVCLQPGVSVARVAMQYGVNANLVRAWISKRHEVPRVRERVAAEGGAGEANFVSLPIKVPAKQSGQTPALRAQGVRAHVRLPNGVEFDLSEAGPEALAALIGILGAMGCSGSTRR